MTRIGLDIPKACAKCGFYNFNIHGAAYKGRFNYIIIRVTCMRCGSTEKEIRVKNT